MNYELIRALYITCSQKIKKIYILKNKKYYNTLNVIKIVLFLATSLVILLEFFKNVSICVYEFN